MADISKELKQIQNAVYGKEVRGSIYDGIDKINKETEKATDLTRDTEHRQTVVEQQFDDLLREWSDDKPTSNAETIASRINRKTGDKYGTLGQRLDDEYETVTVQLSDLGVNVKIIGLKGDGFTNDTEAFNLAIQSYDNLLFPPGVYLIDPLTIANIPSRIKLHFNKGAILKAINTNQNKYEIIRIHDVEDVVITGFPEVIGDRGENQSTSGEWGMGFSIRGSKDIFIENPKATDCWGDGFYIGRTDTKNYSENITIVNPVGDNNRRQGMSIISVKNLRVINPVMKNTNGTAPECGIDIEPNKNDEILQDVVISNPTLNNNRRAGILINLENLENSPNPVDIKILNLYSELGMNGVLITQGRKCEGEIQIDTPIIKETEQSGIYVRNYSKNAPRVDIKKPIIIDSNQVSTGDRYYDSAIVLGHRERDVDVGDRGNIHIHNPSVVDTRNPKKIDRSLYIHSMQDNISILDPVRLDCVNSSIYNVGKTALNISDVNKLLTNEAIANLRLSPSNLGLVYITKQKVVRELTLANSYQIGTELTFINESNHQFIILLEGSQRIYKGDVSTAVGIKSSIFGSSITIKKVDDINWISLNFIGNWSTV